MCENHYRYVGQSKLQVAMTPGEIPRHAELVAGQAFYHESSLRQIVQESQLNVDPEAGQDQVVSLRYGNAGGNQRSALFTE